MHTRRLFLNVLALIFSMSLLLPANGLPAARAAGGSWDISSASLEINSGGEVSVSGSTTRNTISINTSDAVVITLDNVSIDVSAAGSQIAFDSGANVTLYLRGVNTLKSGPNQAGVRVTGAEQLVIDNAPGVQGSLSATGGGYGAGIGGGFMENGGAVTILGGVVRAQGGDNAAGIGGAYTGSGGQVAISGGTITATGGVRAAGIGGGVGGSGGEVIITGGSVKAAGSRSNIGAGYNGAHDGVLTNGFVPLSLVIQAGAVAPVNPAPVSYQIPVSGSNPDYSYVYSYTGSGHGSGDTNLYFYLPTAAVAAPEAPGGLAAMAVSSSQVNLSWIDNDTTGQGFKIERCAMTGCSSFVQIATVGGGVTSYADAGLAAAASYSYRVRAYNAGGDSPYSNTASAMTLTAPALPAAPTNLAATAVSRNQLNLSWTDNADNETGFRIERCKGSSCTNFALIATVGANVTSFANTGLAANTAYRYRISAFNVSGSSGYSNTAAAMTRKR